MTPAPFYAVTDRPTRDEILIRQAQIVAERSTCIRGRVGVVIAHDSRVVSQGYNGAPAGMPHCVHACNCGSVDKYGDDLRDHSLGCPAIAACTRSVHGEANAIAFAAKHGVATKGAELFTTLSPCVACSMLIINAGIVRVVYVNEYRSHEGIHLLRQACVRVWSIAGREIVEHE